MFRKRTLTDAAGPAVEYMDPLVRDEKLRSRLAAALTSARAARVQAQTQTGFAGTVQRLAFDPVLRAHLRETVRQMQAAQDRARKVRAHRLRNGILVLAGLGAAVAAAAPLRRAMFASGGHSDDWAPAANPAGGDEAASVEA
jgi:hypothetical protein